MPITGTNSIVIHFDQFFGWYMNNLVLGLLFGALFLWPCRNLARGDQPSTEALRHLTEGLKARAGAMDPLWVKYRLIVYESAEFQKQMGTKDPKDTTITAQCEYAYKKLKTRRRFVPEDPAKRNWAGADFYIYTGEVTVHPLGENQVYAISKSALPYNLGPLPTEVAGEKVLLGDLQYWAQNPVSAEVLNVFEPSSDGGDPALHLRWRWGEGHVLYDCRVAPSEGWTLHGFDDYWRDGKLCRTRRVADFLTSGGLHYPRKGVQTDYGSDGALHRRTEFEVQCLETRESRIPDSLFEFEVPKGCQVWDEDLKVMVRDTALTESHLAEVIRRLAPRSAWSRWFWYWFSAAIAAPCALLCIALHRLVRRSRVQKPAPKEA